MEFQRPPRPRRSLPPVAGGTPNTFDPVGAVARIWAGHEGEAQALAPIPGRRRSSRSSSRPRSEDSEPAVTVDENAALRRQLYVEEAAVEASLAKAGNLERELQRAAESSLAQVEHLERDLESSQALAVWRQTAEQDLAAELTKELTSAKGVYANEVSQRQGFESQLEAKCQKRCLEEAEQLRARLMHEFGEHEEAIRKLCQQRMQDELVQQARQQRDAWTHEHANHEDLLQKQAEAFQHQRIAENETQKETQKELEIRFHKHEQEQEVKLEQSEKRAEMLIAQSDACAAAEQLVKHLEQREAQAEQYLREQCAHQEELRDSMSQHCRRLEELSCQRDAKLKSELAERLIDEQEVLQNRYESRTQVHLEDCLAAMGRREAEAETEARSRMQAEMVAELARDKEVQIVRLQKLMEKKLAEGLARQQGNGEEIQRKQHPDVAEQTAEKDSEVLRLRGELAEERHRRHYGNHGSDFLQAEELQKLLEMAHGENTGLRETIRDLRGEINTQAGEIQLLEEKVLDTLSGLRSDGGRANLRGGSAAGLPRASSVPSKVRDSTPPRVLPGDIRRLPPQPKSRHSSNAP